MNAICLITRTTAFVAAKTTLGIAYLTLRVADAVKDIFLFLTLQTGRTAFRVLCYSFNKTLPLLKFIAFIAFIHLLKNLLDDAPPPPPFGAAHRPPPLEILRPPLGAPPLGVARGIERHPFPPALRAPPHVEAPEVLAIIDRVKAATAHQQERIEELLTAGIGRQYYCSITLELIRDPVRDPTARGEELVYYERASITQALGVNARSPHTRQPLTVAQLLEAPPDYFAVRREALLNTFHEELEAILGEGA